MQEKRKVSPVACEAPFANLWMPDREPSWGAGANVPRQDKQQQQRHPTSPSFIPRHDRAKPPCRYRRWRGTTLALGHQPRPALPWSRSSRTMLTVPLSWFAQGHGPRGAPCPRALAMPTYVRLPAAPMAKGGRCCRRPAPDCESLRLETYGQSPRDAHLARRLARGAVHGTGNRRDVLGQWGGEHARIRGLVGRRAWRSVSRSRRRK